MPQTADKISYKETLNLPRTDFPMKAGLVQNEPARLEKWRASGLYERIQQRHAGDPTFTLHDGPPFANGDIHLGHVVNKVLKDVVLRFRTMQGHRTPYVPGWDCHGLPIEHKIAQDLGPKLREMPTVEVRKKCRDYAAKYVGVQSQQFQRLGILGDWADPYLTMAPAYEAAALEVFARFVEHGLVYKRLKPVHWSTANQTALADAELEYKDRDDVSVFVEFPFANPGMVKGKFGLRQNAAVSLLIWTTTPWTLPANLAIAVNPEVDYDFVAYDRDGSRITVVASALREKVFGGEATTPAVVEGTSKAGDGSDEVLTERYGETVSTNGHPKADAVAHRVLATVPGRDLLELEYLHPFMDRVGRVLPAEYVTTTDGTGLVHTAPGHGEEDFETGRAHGLDAYSPVRADGRYDSTVPPFLAGLTVWEGNGAVVERLKELGVLFAEKPIRHSYPHDWRSKTPTIFRATEQWFVALDKPFAADDAPEATLRDRALAAADATGFVPSWGRARLTAMLHGRPDWCVSRQRAWGLPIPVFYNDAGEPLLTPASVRAVAATFAEHGSDAWFTMSPADLLGDHDPGPDFPVESLRKEQDIFDVWFESGSSWNAVLNARPDLPDAPADLYLEGSDQHRGWFQLSLLSAIGATGRPPFKSLLTHGFVVKPDGTKVSKSDKEYVKATQEIDRHGADLLRLWTCSMDVSGDLPASPKALADFGDKYRKIRNTLRYLLSNVPDFDPATDAVEPAPDSLDGWMAAELDTLVRDVTAAYGGYQIHRAFRLLHDFCVVPVSSVYGNAMKDRLYCDAADSPRRRSAQTVMYRSAVALTKLLAPMLAFTADEAWEHLPHRPAGEDVESVHEALLPTPVGAGSSDAWRLLMSLRESALAQLDALKKSAGLNKSTDAEVVYRLNPAARERLKPFGEDLADVVGAGCHSFADATGPESVEVVDRRDDYAACARSWKRRPDVGSDPDYPDLSARDADVMRRSATDVAAN